MKDNKRHPMQPIEVADDGVIRFRRNKIVIDLLNKARKQGGFGLNEIVTNHSYSTEDLDQLYQLIGYSVSGYGELTGVVSRESIKEADAIADLLQKEKHP